MITQEGKAKQCHAQQARPPAAVPRSPGPWGQGGQAARGGGASPDTEAQQRGIAWLGGAPSARSPTQIQTDARLKVQDLEGLSHLGYEATGESIALHDRQSSVEQRLTFTQCALSETRHLDCLSCLFPPKTLHRSRYWHILTLHTRHRLFAQGQRVTGQPSQSPWPAGSTFSPTGT